MTRRPAVPAAIEANLRSALTGLEAVVRDFDRAREGIRLSHAGLPAAASYEGTTSRGLSVGSSVERHALNTDPLAHARDHYERCFVAAEYHARHVEQAIHDLGVAQRAFVARPATDKERREVAHVNDVKPSCVHCTERRLEIRKEVEHAQNGPSDVGGLLPSPLVLCRWCKDVVRQVQRLPSEREIDRHANRQRLRIEATS